MKTWCVVLVFSLLSNYGSAKPAEYVEVDSSLSNQGIAVSSNYGSVLDSIQSSIFDAVSRASNLMEYTNVINGNAFMSLADKTQYLNQLASFSSEQLNMVQDLFAMLGDVINNHIQWKLKVIQAAKEKFDLALEALANGDTETAEAYFYEALYTLPKMCPIFHALKYALTTEDYDMMSFVGKMGQLILGHMEAAVDVSLSV